MTAPIETDLRTVIADCYDTARANGFYEETTFAQLPADTESLIFMLEEVIRTGRRANFQRKRGRMAQRPSSGDVQHDEAMEGRLPDPSPFECTFTPRTVHIMRQLMHLQCEIGEVSEAYASAGLREIDYEELADIAIVLFDLIGYLDTDRFLAALSAKRIRNGERGKQYGCAAMAVAHE